MDSKIILRKIASATVNFIRLVDASSRDSYTRIEGETVALGSGKRKLDPMTAWNAMVAQQHRSSVEISDYEVYVAIIEEIPYSKTTGNSWLHESRPCLCARVTKGAILLVHSQYFWLAVTSTCGQGIDLRVNMTGDFDEIKPAVVVEIDERRAPLNKWQRWKSSPRLVGDFLEVPIAEILVEIVVLV